MKPRRPFYDDVPDGLLESDRDFINNNFDACVAFLEEGNEIIKSIRELILKWKGMEADMLAFRGHLDRGINYIIDEGKLHTLQACIADLQALYAQLVD